MRLVMRLVLRCFLSRNAATPALFLMFVLSHSRQIREQYSEIRQFTVHCISVSFYQMLKQLLLSIKSLNVVRNLSLVSVGVNTNYVCK
jgi:hypothetical protein